jgi:acyl dehydratase
MSTDKKIYFEDIAVGEEIPFLTKGPMTTPHLMRWSASIENFHKIHYDAPFAINHDKLPGLLVNGSLKQQFLMQLLTEWVGNTGWVWKANFQFRVMNLIGETLTIWGKVTDKRDGPGYGLVDLDIGIRNDAGVESTPGKAVVALPYTNGRPVPYPFVAPTA